MASLEEKFIECLKFLESIRPGYKYKITLGIDQKYTTASVVGENYSDNSLPTIFLTVRATNFIHLPEAIQVESARLIKEEVDKKAESVAKLNKEIEELLSKMKQLVDLKSKLE